MKKVKILINRILFQEKTDDEWLQLQKDIHKFFCDPTVARKDHAELFEYTEMVAMVCSGIKEDRGESYDYEDDEDGADDEEDEDENETGYNYVRELFEERIRNASSVNCDITARHLEKLKAKYGDKTLPKNDNDSDV
ncbi:MAG: hypothetical protein LBT55_01745 [Clostridiaceae bacterium]|jgi:hypothetical protein|nr:hypothetical protein [Clostridiaceae bacterium]